jgi:hypothetical protein
MTRACFTISYILADFGGYFPGDFEHTGLAWTQDPGLRHQAAAFEAPGEARRCPALLSPAGAARVPARACLALLADVLASAPRLFSRGRGRPDRLCVIARAAPEIMTRRHEMPRRAENSAASWRPPSG